MRNVCIMFLGGMVVFALLYCVKMLGLHVGPCAGL